MKKFTNIQNINEDLNFIDLKSYMDKIKAIVLYKKEDGSTEFGILSGNNYMQDDAYEVILGNSNKEIINTEDIQHIKWFRVNETIDVNNTDTKYYNVDIEQVAKTRNYNVFYNDIYVGSIENKSTFDNKNLENVLKAEAEYLVKTKKLIPLGAHINTAFVGNIEHVKN